MSERKIIALKFASDQYIQFSSMKGATQEKDKVIDKILSAYLKNMVDICLENIKI
jgi:hypothetical protein